MTLKCDLVTQCVCRLLNHMDARGLHQATPRPPDQEGSRAPWRLYQNYVGEVLMMRHGALEDEGIEFSIPSAPAQPAEPLAA